MGLKNIAARTYRRFILRLGGSKSAAYYFFYYFRAKICRNAKLEG